MKSCKSSGAGGRRRDFLRSAGSAAALAALSQGCLLKQREAGKPLHMKKRMKSSGGGPDPLPPTGVFPDIDPASVGLVGIGDSVHEAVREAVMAAGGLDEIEPGQRVLIKPNICGPAIRGRYPGRITTSPEVVRSVIRLCKERGAEVIVSERSMIGTELAFKTSGIARVCHEEKVRAFPWTRAEYVLFKPGRRHWSQGFRYPRILDEVDHFINVPLLKNHGVGGADFTCCLKSFVGVAMPLDRHQEGPDALHTNNIGEKVAELNLCAKPLINIVDATEIMVAGGPDGLKKKASIWVKPKMIMASRDRVACDSVAFATLRLYGAEAGVKLPYISKRPGEQVQIYYSAELGLGQADPSKIEIVDKGVSHFDEIKSNWL